MDFLAAGHRGDTDIQDESVPGGGHAQHPDLDDAHRDATLCGRAGPQFELCWTSVWSGSWLLLFVARLARLGGPLMLTGLPTGGLGYLKYLAPPEKVLRFVEGKLNLLGRLPHYVSIDQKTYGRFGVLPTSGSPPPRVAMGLVGSNQRLGP